MMGRNGEVECCMCGDHGLSSELFKCSSCGFRSQHKYCSNLYPRAESYHICNWCLSQNTDGEGDGNTKLSSPSSVSHKSRTDHREMKIKKSKIRDDGRGGGTVDERIKKPSKFPATTAAEAGRKRAAGGGTPEGIVKRNRSEGGMIIRPVFRNRVRRYKLLDEVSS